MTFFCILINILVGFPGDQSNIDFTFTPRLVQLYTGAMSELGLDRDNMTVVHWIRKPNTSFCINAKTSKRNSIRYVSCGTVRDLLYALKPLIPNNYEISNIYLATNEVIRKELKLIKTLGFKILNAGKHVYSDILRYVLDLQFMMKANYLISWGRNSSTLGFVTTYRHHSRELSLPEEAWIDASIAGPEVHILLAHKTSSINITKLKHNDYEVISDRPIDDTSVYESVDNKAYGWGRIETSHNYSSSDDYFVLRIVSSIALVSFAILTLRYVHMLWHDRGDW